MKKNLQTPFNYRQYMLSKDFELYYYSNKDIKSIPGHNHNYYEFYFFLGGEILMEIDGLSFSPSPGDMILIPPFVPHHVKIINPNLYYQRFIFWISQDYYNRLKSVSKNYAYIMNSSTKKNKYLHSFNTYIFNEIQSKLFQLIEEINSSRFGKETRISISINDLIFFLNRSVYEMRNPINTCQETNLYKNLLSYIQDRFDEDLSLDHLSKIFFVSKYHLSHIFKQNAGISIHQYILKKRLDVVKNAMLGNIPINEACLLYGFNDYSSFYKAFKKEYGISPKEYRNLYLKP